MSIGLCIETLNSVGSINDLRNAYSVISVDGDDFTARENPVIYDKLDRLVDSRIQFDNRSDAKLHDFFKNHFGFAETNRDGKLHVQQDGEIAGFLVLGFID